MSNAFHVNLKTGETGPCSAKKRGCPFGGDEVHFTSEEAAREAYEKVMAGQAIAPAAKKIVVTEDEKKVRNRINEGNIQNGDRVAYIGSDGKRELATIVERRGEMLIEFPGHYAKPVRRFLTDGKIVAREPGEITKQDVAKEIEEQHAKLRRLRNADRVAEVNKKLDKLREQHAAFVAAEKQAALDELATLSDEQLARRDRSARNYSYEATMSDYSMESISRAQNEVSLIQIERDRRREEAIKAGDKPYDDGTRPSDYSDQPGYGVLTDAGAKYNIERKGYLTKNGDLIEEVYVDGRGHTYKVAGKHYPTPQAAFAAAI